MAWNYADQIHALSGFDADNTADSDTGEDFNILANQWLTDAAKEIINALPPHLLKLCTSAETFTSAAVGSEAETLNTGKVLAVFAGNYQARPIPSTLKHKANDPDSIEYATTTDPVYYIESNKINVLPSGISTCKYEEVQYPTITYNMTAVTSVSLTGVVATLATPTVLTKASHGLVNGDIVKLSGFTEATELNGITGIVEGVAGDDFQLDGVYVDGAAETTGGNVEKVNGSFPDEAENLIPLRAAITAAEYQMAIEEDPETFGPVIANLKHTYEDGLNILKTGSLPQGQQAAQ
tara:strand:- start:306 stop:1187 length:882 start_codon:yes stop_codon:yes gene_type:complete